ncbi:hypothetical protein [Aurantiacibacter gangjinensis]|uniref:hypothetical protein n=1 Tax=Aurantiacibacter gangjinensis TaxID=502682 RepID=UPI0012E05E3B|nr:hypothetical protein [Aurantiacibacter gangjinensis]
MIAKNADLRGGEFKRIYASVDSSALYDLCGSPERAGDRILAIGNPVVAPCYHDASAAVVTRVAPPKPPIEPDRSLFLQHLQKVPNFDRFAVLKVSAPIRKEKLVPNKGQNGHLNRWRIFADLP